VPLAALLVVALSLSLIATFFDLPHSVARAAAARPNIVMFYLDDFAPYPSHLTEREARTPELARFAEHGLRFENAIVSTPLCGPSRANMLTGRYGHNNGVTQNEIGPYRPDFSIGRKMSSRGYHSAFVGKHINRLAVGYPTRASMSRLASGWDRFDVIWENQGKFYDWRQYRKGGTRSFGSGRNDHSSYQAARSAVQHIERTPPDEPLFMVVSLFDGHTPLTPMKRFENHPSCRFVAPWQGPAFNEADVSDKPAHIRRTPKLPISGYRLQERCEQALTVDFVVGEVRQALKRSGRFDDTLQVLTSDNGWLMGDHRLEGKTHPYATSVPLYMRWPARLGHEPRTISEPVSNVDLAATFCALSGCTTRGADGMSLLPLIEGTRDRLERDYLWVEMLHGNRWRGRLPSARPAWAGVETTLSYSDTRWAYTRYRSRDEELYDLSSDPHRIQNLVGDAAHAGVLADMRGFWLDTWRSEDVRWRGRIPMETRRSVRR
jgi:arylsulfatase A-like enzyme